MLHIGLILLKIAGLVLLGLLVLLLALLLAVLLVPARYLAKGSYDEELRGTVKVSWLLHIVSFRLVYEKELSWTLRVLGIRLFRPKKKKAKKIRKKKPHRSGKEAAVRKLQPPEPLDPGLRPEPPKEPKPEPMPDRSFVPEEPVDDRLPFSERIWNSIRNLIKKIKDLFYGFLDKLKKIGDYKEQITEWFQDEVNQNSLRLLYKEWRRLWKKLRPKKLKADLTFGFDDPYVTGQVLSYASLLYPFYGKNLSLCPMFDREILKGSIYIKGRMRAGTFLALAFRLYRDKNIKTLMKQWLR